jgi:hypothetical protein
VCRVCESSRNSLLRCRGYLSNRKYSWINWWVH